MSTRKTNKPVLYSVLISLILIALYLTKDDLIALLKTTQTTTSDAATLPILFVPDLETVRPTKPLKQQKKMAIPDVLLRIYNAQAEEEQLKSAQIKDQIHQLEHSINMRNIDFEIQQLNLSAMHKKYAEEQPLTNQLPQVSPATDALTEHKHSNSSPELLGIISSNSAMVSLNGATKQLSIGGQFGGYRVTKIDQKTGQVGLEKKGRALTLLINKVISRPITATKLANEKPEQNHDFIDAFSIPNVERE